MNDGQEIKNPRNLQAILDWCQIRRPDLFRIISDKRNNDAFILLLTAGFEAGRKFQHDHPELELDNPGVYLEISSGAT